MEFPKSKVGMAMEICKSIQCGVISTLFGGIPSLYVLSFLKCFFLWLVLVCFFWRENGMVAALQLVAI